MLLLSLSTEPDLVGCGGALLLALDGLSGLSSGESLGCFLMGLGGGGRLAGVGSLGDEFCFFATVEGEADGDLGTAGGGAFPLRGAGGCGGF